MNKSAVLLTLAAIASLVVFACGGDPEPAPTTIPAPEPIAAVPSATPVATPTTSVTPTHTPTATAIPVPAPTTTPIPTASVSGEIPEDSPGGPEVDIDDVPDDFRTGLPGYPDSVIIVSLAFSPVFETDDTIYASTLRRGIFRSTDAGGTWAPVNNGLTDPTVSSVVISPDFQSDGTLLAGTLGGIFRSDDRGESWLKVGPTTVIGLVGSPEFDENRNLFAITPDGFARSTDAGETWQLIDQAPAASFFAPVVAFSSTFEKDRTMFGLSEDGDVLRSTDGGETWRPLVVDPRYENLYLQALALSPAFGTDNLLFAYEQFGGVLRSNDRGDTWEYIGDLNRGAFVVSLAISPAYETDKTLYICLGLTIDSINAVFRFTDGTWQQIAGYETECLTDVDIVFIAVSPAFADDNTLFAGTLRSGLYRSTDRGDSWESVNLDNSSPSNVSACIGVAS